MNKEESELKIGVFIHERPFLRSWVHSDVISSLSASFQITVFYDKHRVTLKPSDFPANIKCVGLDFYRSEFKGNLLNDVLLFEYHDKSPTFSYRKERYVYGWYLWRFNLLTLKRLLSGFVKVKKFRLFVYKSLRYLVLFQISRRFVLKLLDNWLNSFQTLRISDELTDLDLAIVPSNGAENFINPFICQLNRLQINSLLALDNWDNISSKTILRGKPTYVTAMGCQSARHANLVQGIDQENIWLTGLSRFESYRKFMQADNSINVKELGLKKRVVYLGCAIPHNEVTLISKLIEMELFKDLDFIYRPHPQAVPRLGEDRIDLISLGVKYDDSSGPINPQTGWPETTSTFVKLIRNADLVIATPTTLALEAIMLGGNVIIDGTVDGVNRTSAGIAIDRYLHLRDLRNVKNLEIASDFDKLIGLCETNLAFESTDREKIDISDLLFFNEVTFSQTLTNYIKKNIKRSKDQASNITRVGNNPITDKKMFNSLTEG